MVFYSLERAEKRPLFQNQEANAEKLKVAKRHFEEQAYNNKFEAENGPKKIYRLLDKCTQTDNWKTAAAVVTVQYGINGEGLHGLMMRKALTPQTPDQQVLPPPLPRREKIPWHEHPLTHTHTHESQLHRTQTSRNIARILTQPHDRIVSLSLALRRTDGQGRTKTKHTGWMEGGHVLYSADRIKQAVRIDYTLVPQV